MMELILLEKITNLGSLGDKVRVKPGYARNYLLPQGKAVRATAEKLAEVEQRRADLERQAAEKLAAANHRAEEISQIGLTLTGKAGDEGKLFGSIGIRDIVDAFQAAGITIDKHEVRMPSGPLRFVGEHVIQLSLHSEVLVDFTVQVAAE